MTRIHYSEQVSTGLQNRRRTLIHGNLGGWVGIGPLSKGWLGYTWWNIIVWLVISGFSCLEFPEFSTQSQRCALTIHFYSVCCTVLQSWLTQFGGLGEILYVTPLHQQFTYAYKRNRIALFFNHDLSFITRHLIYSNKLQINKNLN